MLYGDAQACQEVEANFPTMTIYYLFLLKKGPTWVPEAIPELEKLQKIVRLIFELHAWMIEKNILP
jgi:hypothetical protein